MNNQNDRIFLHFFLYTGINKFGECKTIDKKQANISFYLEGIVKIFQL